LRNLSCGSAGAYVNAVIHRANIDRIAALVKRQRRSAGRWKSPTHSIMAGPSQPTGPMRRAADLPCNAGDGNHRPQYLGRLVIDLVVPDYYARRPKACMGGWARRSLNVTPSGRVLPCHAAETIPGLAFWSVRDRSLDTIWRESPAFQAFRGTEWMPEPCRSCDQREIDFGGCRCQALAITATRRQNPACELSPHHARLLALAEADSVGTEQRYAYRGRVATPFQLTERRGRVARVVVVEQLPSVRPSGRSQVPRAKGARSDQAARILRQRPGSAHRPAPAATAQISLPCPAHDPAGNCASRGSTESQPVRLPSTGVLQKYGRRRTARLPISTVRSQSVGGRRPP
jgi:radical SAM protein with 4Fe4S-binding SPASM domain